MLSINLPSGLLFRIAATVGVTTVMMLIVGVLRLVIHGLLPTRIEPDPDPGIEAEIERLEAATDQRSLVAVPLMLAGMAPLPLLTWRAGHGILERFVSEPGSVVLWYGIEPVLACHALAGIALAKPLYDLWYMLWHGSEHARLVRLADARHDERVAGGIGRALHRHGRWLFVGLIVFPLIVWGDLYTVVSARGIDAADRDAFAERQWLPHSDIERFLVVRRRNRLDELNPPIRYVVYRDGTVLSSDTNIDVLADLGVSWAPARMESAFSLIEAAYTGEAEAIELTMDEEIDGVTNAVQGIRRH